MKSAFFSIKLLIFHERRDIFCSSDNGIFFTGKTRQAIVTKKTSTIENQIMKRKSVMFSKIIPKNGPTAAAKLVLNP